MAARRYRLTIERGTDWTHTFTVVDSTGAAVNITGNTFTMQIRTGPDGALYASPAMAIVTAGSGTVSATLTDTETEDLPAGELAYDVLRTTGAGAVSRVFEGVVQVNARITDT